ncbi:MAG: uroporphyrinogen decarboxylase family protein [Melioribacteraceae bacterium]|nr:uroporphyrinogen decarboxylase family protein [Melioribacteraceae bacterium]
MTKKEKLNNLVKGTNLSEIAFFRPILMNFAAHFINKKYSHFASDYKVLVESNIKCMEEFNMDAVGLISDPYREASAFGAEITFPEDRVPECRNHLITGYEDVVNLKIPDIYKSNRTLDRLKGIEEFKKILGNDVPVIGWIEGPMAEACDLAGVSEMLMQTMLDEKFTAELIYKATQMAKLFAKAQIDAGCDVIGIGDAICSQISQETFSRFEKEPLREIIDYIHENNALVKLHICGNITHLLKDISEIKPDIVDLDFLVDMDNAYEILDPEIIRCGNINPVDIEQKTPEEIYDITKELCIKERDRKFILSGGCEITINTPYENLKAMRSALDDSLN